MNYNNVSRREFLRIASIVSVLPNVAAVALSASSNSKPVTKETLEMKLGDSKVQILKITGKDTGIVYWRPHSDEQIAAQAIEEHINRYGGTGYIILPDSNQRDINFEIGGQPYKIDPNRVFTERGIVEQCKAAKGTPKYNAIKAFADEWLIVLKGYQVIVAAHNNENGFSGDGKGGLGTVSIKLYEEKYKDKYPGAVHIAPHEDDDDLIWVTNKNDFIYLATVIHPNDPSLKGYNLVLEPNVFRRGAYDDGSASVVFSQPPHKKRYFNCETEKGVSKPRLLKMLRVIHEYTAK